jgi:ribosomal protein S18 acetylase RimI-like enzyme
MQPVVATPADLALLADSFAAAFGDDPMARWRRTRSTPEETVGYYRGVLDEYVALGVLWRLGDRAAAAWMSPEDTRRRRATRADRHGTGPVDRARDGSPLPDHELWGWLDSHLPDHPVVFLDLLAVAPEAQGAGLGGVLVRHGLARAAAVGLTAFLETSNDRNLAFYESHGFRVVDQGYAPGGGPMIWFLQTGQKPLHS